MQRDFTLVKTNLDRIEILKYRRPQQCIWVNFIGDEISHIGIYGNGIIEVSIQQLSEVDTPIQCSNHHNGYEFEANCDVFTPNNEELNHYIKRLLDVLIQVVDGIDDSIRDELMAIYDEGMTYVNFFAENSYELIGQCNQTLSKIRMNPQRKSAN